MKMKPCRNPCKECPWIVKNKHNDSWPKYVEDMKNSAQIQEKTHACHMITSDTWGYENIINENNVCIGSLLTI